MLGASRRWIMRSLILLRTRHVRSLQGGQSHRAILAKHMASFTPVAQHHFFCKEDISANTTLERNFPWHYRRIPSRREDSDMPLAIPNISIKFVSAFKDLYHFSEVGEGKFHCLITYIFRKIDSDEDRLLPISERPTPFVETQRDICFAKTALDRCILKFLLLRL